MNLVNEECYEIKNADFRYAAKHLDVVLPRRIQFISLFCFELKYQALNLSKNPIKAKSELS